MPNCCNNFRCPGPTYHREESERIEGELAALDGDERYAEDGIIKTILRNRIRQEQQRSRHRAGRKV